MSPAASRRPASTLGTGTPRITGRVTLNLMVPLSEAIAQAGEVESLPPCVTVILRVAGSPDPAVINRLRSFGSHVLYDVHGRDGRSTAAWIAALSGDGGWFR